mgnify:CR=1 FL=1
MKQKIVRRASALVLAGCLLAGAALPALAASAKEEVIYANLDASGTVTGVYAVNSFAVQAGDTVTDHGSYTAVRNMTTTDPLEHSGDTVTATVAQDGKLYYEGTMDTATALPWLVKLTYTLDGAEIAPEELGGKSGALTIRLQVSRNPDCTGDFFDQYALQVTMTLDTDRAQNIVADGATMANVGSNKQLSYILLPGSDSDVTVTADVTDGAHTAFAGAQAEHVSFSYADEEVLHDLSLTIPEKKIVGITGRSGSGKSTFLRLLMRFWDVNTGTIRFGEEDIRRVNTATLRAQESLVTQETELFNDTIENNIRIAKRDATREEVEAACKKAALDGFIRSLPKGYDTPVGELGGALSGGERQRIGVARAFLHDAPFLLLDEPTSNLDSLNEGVILKAVRAECRDKTVLLVSHRKSTMAAADVTYSVESGRLS